MGAHVLAERPQIRHILNFCFKVNFFHFNTAHNIIKKGEVINDYNRDSFSRTIPEVYVPLKSKKTDRKPSSHKGTSF